jgi:hypothetical protein
MAARAWLALPLGLSRDGAMVVWISLAAVVVIIIVIGVAFRLFLRADDVDPFEEVPEEPRRSRRVPDAARTREPAPREMPAPRETVAASTRRQPHRPGPLDHQPRPADRAPHSRDRQHSPDRQPVPDRRNSGGQPRPVPAAAQATKWDKMSDVDYWSELKAAEKQQAAAESAPPARSRRRPPEPVPDVRAASRGDRTEVLPTRQRADRPGRPAPASGGRPADYGQPQPSGPRPAHSPGRYAGGKPEPATESIAALARMAGQPSAAPPPVLPSRPQARPVPPPPLDDDPLTSPSFPAVNTSDSRSYRSRRSDSKPGRAPAAAGYGEPAQPPRTYPAPPDRTMSPPNGYPSQPGMPTGNPYGSFVSQPAASYQPEIPAAGPQMASRGKHAGNGQPPQSSQPPPSSQPLPSAPAGNGWYGADYLSAPPAAGHDQAGYQGGPSDTVAYAQQGHAGVPYDQRGYAAQEPPYGLEGHQGYQGYGNGGY